MVNSELFIIKTLQKESLKKYANFLKGIVLDIGCGVKPYKQFLSCEKYIGIDESKDVNPDFIGTVTDIPFEDGYFDSTLCTEVLEHVPDIEKAVDEINRVMKYNGYLYLTVPQSWCIHYEPKDFWRFTKYGIIYILEKSGFEVLRIERIGGIFSLIGQRLVDVLWHFLSRLFAKICGLKCAEKIASIFIFSFSIFFYLLGKIGDNIDKRDALGWAVLARKRNNLIVDINL